MNPAELARVCASAAADKKAADLVALDMSGVSSFTDCFLIASADSEPQLKAIAAEIRERLRNDFGIKPLSEDGFPASQWVVLDYGDIIIHLFHSEKRRHYGLEELWKDAPRIDLPT
jgi:ribosome-associated protein